MLVIYLFLELPENYILEEQPKSSKITLPDNGGEYTYQVNYADNKVVVKYAFNTDKTQYIPSEYEFLKEFYNQIIAKENQILILKKTEPTALQ